MARRGLKTCCIATAVSLVFLIVVIVTLSLTIFKPKDPQITARPIGLEKLQLDLSTPIVPLTMLLTIDNPNYGSFHYQRTTGYVHYHGTIVAEVPLPANKSPARSKVNMTTSANMMVDKVILNPSFWSDITAGFMNFTSTATIRGKVRMAKIIKLPATVYNTCNLSIHLLSQSEDSQCSTRLKL